MLGMIEILFINIEVYIYYGILNDLRFLWQAGDVASFYSQWKDTRQRLEHYNNAEEQVKVAAIKKPAGCCELAELLKQSSSANSIKSRSNASWTRVPRVRTSLIL